MLVEASNFLLVTHHQDDPRDLGYLRQLVVYSQAIPLKTYDENTFFVIINTVFLVN